MPSHDHSYKTLFSHPKVVKSFFVEFLEIARPDNLDFESLDRVNGSYVVDTGQARHSDIVWKIRINDTRLYLYLLLEFQSESDPVMALRMQVYVGLLLQDLYKRKDKAYSTKLPTIVPVVLYIGKAPWTAPLELVDLLERAPPDLQPFQPRQRYIMIDQKNYTDGTTPTQDGLLTTLFNLEFSPNTSELLAKLNAMLSDPSDSALRRDMAQFIGQMLQPVLGDFTIPPGTDLSEVEPMIARRKVAWWVVAEEKATAQGLEKGLEQGLEQGLEKGLEKGLEQGRVKGECTLLQKLLQRRFGALPEWVTIKLASATEDDLIRWGEAVIDAKDLNEVFAR